MDVRTQNHYNLVRNKNFLLFFSGKLISKMGDSIYLFALSWYMFDKYSSPMLAGVMMMLGTIPTVLLGPFVGIIADKFDRKKIVVLMDYIRAAVVCCVAITIYLGILKVWFLFLVAVILDICAAIFNPASTAMIPNIVGKENLAKANSIDAIIINSSDILGILCGGLLYSTIGFATITVLNTISFLISGTLGMMVILPRKKSVVVDTEGKRRIVVFVNDMIEGYRFLRSKTGLFKLFAFTTLFNFLFAPFYSIYLLIILNKLIKAASQNLAYVQAAYALGAIVGAVALVYRLKDDRMSATIINGLWMSNLLMAGLAIPILPCFLGKVEIWISTLYFSGLVLFIGVFASFVAIPVGVIYQKTVPDEVLGRVAALVSSISSAAIALGYLMGGIVAEIIPMYLLILITVFILLVLTAFMHCNKCIREL